MLSEEKAAASFTPVTTSANGTGQAGLVNSATGAAGALAGWAFASFGKQLSSNEVHSSLSAAAPSNTSLAPPFTNGASSNTTPATSPRPSTDSSFLGATASSSKPSSIGVKKAESRVQSGMKLGSKGKPQAPEVNLADTLVGEWEEEEGVENAWGDGDLIDVNADTDDWAAFESAPVPEIVVPPPQSYYAPKPSGVNLDTLPPKSSTSPKPPIRDSKPKPGATNLIPAPAVSRSPIVSIDDWGDDDAVSTPSMPTSPAKTAVQPSLAGMSKEEKDKEMARRREERKAVGRMAIDIDGSPNMSRGSQR